MLSLSRPVLRVALLRGVFFLMPIIALVSPLGLAPLAILTAALVLAVTPYRFWRLPPRHLIVLLFLTPVLAAFSAFWSADPVLSVKAAGQIGAIALTALVLAVSSMDNDGPNAAMGAVYGMALVLLLLLVDRLVGNRIIGFLHGLRFDYLTWEVFAQASTKRGTTVIAILVWSVAGAFFANRQRLMAVLTLAVGAGCVFSGYSSTAKLAFLAGLPVVALFLFAGRRFALAVSALLFVVVLAAPWAVRQLPPPQQLWDTQSWIPNSTHHRLTIWRFSADHSAAKPILGWGMDASRIMPGGDDSIYVTRTVNGQTWGMHEQMLPLHPHNAFLQWWLELGVVGAVTMTSLIVALILATSGLPRWRRGFVMASVFSALVCASSAFGAWQSWWLLALVLISVPAMANVRNGDGHES